MYRPAPSAADSEQTLVDCGAVLLVGGDHRGQDTAIHQKLHAQVFILREQVRINDFLQNQFVMTKLCSKCHKSSSYLSQAFTVQKNVLNIFSDMETLTGVKQTETIPILSPESAEFFRAIPTRKKKALNPRSFRLIRVSVQRCIDGMRRGEGEKVWLKKVEGREVSLMSEFSEPVFRNSLLAESFKFLFLHRRAKKLKG